MRSLILYNLGLVNCKNKQSNWLTMSTVNFYVKQWLINTTDGMYSSQLTALFYKQTHSFVWLLYIVHKEEN